MTSPTPIQEPDFEGEEMKLPDGTPTTSNVPASSLLNGPIILLLFLILFCLLGGLYYWTMVASTPPVTPPESTRPTADQNREPETPTAVARTQALDVVSTSDDLGAIEADLLSTNLDELDLELNAIEAELEAALQVP